MKLGILTGAICTVLAFGFAATPVSAQLEDNLTSLTGDQTEGYLGPLAKGLSATLNSGIFRTGNIPAVGLNLTLDLKASYISFADDDRVYTAPATAGFPGAEVPTVIGDTQSVSVPHESVAGLEFAYPGGFDMGNFGIAVPQITVGSALGTRAMFRYISLSLGDDEDDLGDFELIGIGGQHSLTRYFPGLPLDLAVGAMWQKFTIGEDDLVDATALAFNVTGSRTFGAVITVEPYVGLGIDSFEMDASYDTGDETIEVSFDRENDLHLTLGANANLPVVKVHAEVNVAAENGFAGGLSFGI